MSDYQEVERLYKNVFEKKKTLSRHFTNTSMKSSYTSNAIIEMIVFMIFSMKFIGWIQS